MNRKTATDALQTIGRHFSNRKIGESNDMETLMDLRAIFKIGLSVQFVIYIEAVAMLIIMSRGVKVWNSYEITIGVVCGICTLITIVTMLFTAKTLLEPKYRLVKRWKKIRETILNLGDEPLEKAINTYHHETPEDCYALWVRNVLEQIGRIKEMDRSRSSLTERERILEAKGLKWLNIVKAEFNSVKNA